MAGSMNFLHDNIFFFFSSRRRHTRLQGDWSSDVCSSDLYADFATGPELTPLLFYLAPVALVAWYAGRGPALGVACAGAIAWLLSDALTHGAYAHWSIPYRNGVLRLEIGRAHV